MGACAGDIDNLQDDDLIDLGGYSSTLVATTVGRKYP